MAAVEAQRAVAKSCETLSATFAQLDKNSDSLSKGMKAFLSTGSTFDLTHS
jgi:hypothetical protein